MFNVVTTECLARVSVRNETSGTPCILVYLQSLRKSGEMLLIKKSVMMMKGQRQKNNRLTAF
jgi:hypothetical protein